MTQGWGQTFQAGRYSASLEATTGLEWNSNPTFSATSQLPDLFWTAGVSLKSKWELTKENNISFTLGADYRDAFEHNELDSRKLKYTFFPNTNFEALVRFSEVLYLHLNYEITYLTSPVDAVGVDANGNLTTEAIFYERISSNGSASLQWDLSDFDTLTFTLSRHDLDTFTRAFANTELTTHAVSANWQHLWNKGWTTQLVASQSWNDYWQDLQNDSDGQSYSLITTWKATDFLTLVGDVGYYTTKFDSNGTNGDRSDLGGVYWGIEAEHSVSETLSYSLGYRHTTSLGAVSNYKDLHTVMWAGTYSGFNRSTVTGRLGHEWVEDSGGRFAETARRFSGQLEWQFQLGPQLDLTSFYRYTRKTSDRANRGYEQHMAVTQLTYTF